MATTQTPQATARCALCPAGCELGLASAGPDTWRSEYPIDADAGLCPRGSAMGELIGHRRRILEPKIRMVGQLQTVPLDEALSAILDKAGDNEIVLLVDGSIPCEQMLAASAWCKVWPKAKLSLVIEPDDEQLLLGLEASGADYLSDEDLAECDAFVIIGDVFAANPVCARGIFDRRRKQSRTPVVVIDPAAGSATKFATHRVSTPAGGELGALLAVAASAGAKVKAPGASPSKSPSAAAAGQAIAKCKKLGVIVSAEYGRGGAWRQIGYAAGQLAKALGGAVAPQTSGANALAAVRIAGRTGAISLAQAMAPDAGVRIAVGTDVLGMLGRRDGEILAAAAPIPNSTTEAAEIILPLALVAEMSGTVLVSGQRPTAVAPLLEAPSGVPDAAGLVAALARAAGVSEPQIPAIADSLDRLDAPAPEPAPACEPIDGALLIGRSAMHAGCGSLTGHVSWQTGIRPAPVLRIPPQRARELNLKNAGDATIRANGQTALARVQVAPELDEGVFVLSDGFAEVRMLLPCQIDGEPGGICAAPAAAEVTS